METIIPCHTVEILIINIFRFYSEERTDVSWRVLKPVYTETSELSLGSTF